MHPEFEWDEEIGGKGTILWDPIDSMYKAWSVFTSAMLDFGVAIRCTQQGMFTLPQYWASESH